MKRQALALTLLALLLVGCGEPDVAETCDDLQRDDLAMSEGGLTEAEGKRWDENAKRLAELNCSDNGEQLREEAP